jgi:hypothetical protein
MLLPLSLCEFNSHNDIIHIRAMPCHSVPRCATAYTGKA